MFTLTRKQVFFFIGQRLHAAAISVWVFTTTKLPAGGLLSSAVVANV
jgi:hypothetical protein